MVFGITSNKPSTIDAEALARSILGLDEEESSPLVSELSNPFNGSVSLPIVEKVVQEVLDGSCDSGEKMLKLSDYKNFTAPIPFLSVADKTMTTTAQQALRFDESSPSTSSWFNFSNTKISPARAQQLAQQVLDGDCDTGNTVIKLSDYINFNSSNISTDRPFPSITEERSKVLAEQVLNFDGDSPLTSSWFNFSNTKISPARAQQLAQQVLDGTCDSGNTVIKLSDHINFNSTNISTNGLNKPEQGLVDKVLEGAGKAFSMVKNGIKQAYKYLPEGNSTAVKIGVLALGIGIAVYALSKGSETPKEEIKEPVAPQVKVRKRKVRKVVKPLLSEAEIAARKKILLEKLICVLKEHPELKEEIFKGFL